MSGFSQQTQVEWNPAVKLDWKDFKAGPDYQSPFSANTSSGLSYGWSLKDSGEGRPEFNYNVFAFFVPEKSWVKKGKEAVHLLEHEQLHFDITELHARKLRKVLAEFDPRQVDNVKTSLQKIYNRIQTESKIMQEQYDLETLHSQNEEVQLHWAQKVREELEVLKDYSK